MPSIDNTDAVWKYNLEYHITTVHLTAKLDLYSNLHEISRGEKIGLKTMSQIKERSMASKTRSFEDVSISEEHTTQFAITGRYLFVAYLNQEISSSTSKWHTIGLLPAKKLWNWGRWRRINYLPDHFRGGEYWKSINSKSCRKECTKAGHKQNEYCYRYISDHCAESDCKDSQKTKITCAGPACGQKVSSSLI